MTDHRSWIRNYSLGLVLAALFLVSWISQGVFQGFEFVAEQGEMDWSEFASAFLAATFENWQSEFLQLLSFVLLTTYFIYKGSHESKDSQDRMEAKIDQILEAVGGNDGK
jgi:hypothetical protein